MVPLAIFLTLIALVSRAILDAWYFFTRRPSDALDGKVAIVTGSSRGIGRTIAEHLAKAGAKVMLNGRDAERLEIEKAKLICAGYDVDACQANVTSLEECRRLIDKTRERFGGLDILINNAGVGTRGLFEVTDADVFRRQIDVNVFGSLNPTLLALPYLKQRYGHLVFISTLAGLRGLPNSSPYSMTKMMLTPFAETLNRELKKSHVHTGIIHVGITENDPGKQVLHGNGRFKLLADRPSILTDSQDFVARAVIRNIRFRRFRSILGIKGLIFHMILRFLPGLMEAVLRIGTNRLRKVKGNINTALKSSETSRSSNAPIRLFTKKIKSASLIKKKHRVSHGQVAVISGASDLQTKAIAKQLSKQGVTVILNDRVETSDSNTRRQTETNGPKSSGSIVEITSFADANDLTTYVARKYGRIDFLIIRDALEKNVSLQLGDLSRFRELAQANVLESIDLVKESLRYLHESRGSLLFISSLAGLRCLPGLCPSAMIQMAKRSLAESLGTELASVGIHSGIMYVRDEIKDCSDTGAEWGYNEKFDKDLNAPQAVAEEMALKVLYALLKRKPISIVGSEVRLYYNLRRFLPWLMDYVLPTPIECRNSGQKYSFNLNEKS